MRTSVTVKRVNYTDSQDRCDLIRLLNEYARVESREEVPDLSGLPDDLASFPTAFSVLAYVDSDQSTAIGLVNCFFGFSTFARRRLVNIHDVIVTQSYRGKGVTGAMLDAVERIAAEHDCCRLTLEVHADNEPALRAYEKHGFIGDPNHPGVDTFFMRKSLQV